MRRRDVLAAGALAWLAGCGRTAGQPPTLVIGKPGDISTMDPAITTMSSDFAPIGLAYEKLVRFVMKDGAPTGDVEGELARAWTLDADGRSWVFDLAPGHRFDDGSEVTADAVRFSFERCLKIGRGVAQALGGLEAVEVQDPYRVRFRMAAAMPIFPLILALAPMVVINPRVMRFETNGDLARAWLSEHTAGSGPYHVTGWLRGQRVTLKANPFAAVKPRHFERVVIKVVKDESAYRTQLRKGDIDIYESVTPDAVEPLAAMDGVRVISQPMPLVIALVPNNQRKPLSDVRVRRALAHAVDAAGIARTIVRGRASMIHGVLPDGVPGQDSAIPLIAYDPAEARRLLDDAGIAPGIALTLSYAQTSAASDTVALAIQSQLAKVGIDLRLEVLAPSAMSKVRSGDFDLSISSWYADFPDPWPIMKFAYNSANIGEGLNLSRYSNPAVDRLLNAAEATMDQAERIRLYREAQRIIVSDQPMIDLFSLHGIIACRADIEGFDYSFWQPGIYNAAAMSRRRTESAAA